MRLHDLRHTRSTEVTADLDIIEAKAITGHKDARMVDRYYHPDAQKPGKKLLDAEAKRNEDARANWVSPNQVSTIPTMEGTHLTASQEDESRAGRPVVGRR